MDEVRHIDRQPISKRLSFDFGQITLPLRRIFVKPRRWLSRCARLRIMTSAHEGH